MLASKLYNLTLYNEISIIFEGKLFISIFMIKTLFCLVCLFILF